MRSIYPRQACGASRWCYHPWLFSQCWLDLRPTGESEPEHASRRRRPEVNRLQILGGRVAQEVALHALRGVEECDTDLAIELVSCEQFECGLFAGGLLGIHEPPTFTVGAQA